MFQCHGRSQCGVVGGLFLALWAGAVRAQDPLENAPLAPQSAARAEGSPAAPADSSSPAEAPRPKAKARPEFINKSPAEWRGILSKFQFAVMREKSTEPPFTGKYATGHFKGTFVCAGCDAAHVQSELFSSLSKFDSGTGWPSFYQPFDNRALQTAMDNSLDESRVEVMCRRCGAHLGHVFDDGPPPTGLRFCINSAAIKLLSADGDAPGKAAVGKTTAKTKVKTQKKSAQKSDAPDSAPPATSDNAGARDETNSPTPPPA